MIDQWLAKRVVHMLVKFMKGVCLALYNKVHGSSPPSQSKAVQLGFAVSSQMGLELAVVSLGPCFDDLSAQEAIEGVPRVLDEAIVCVV